MHAIRKKIADQNTKILYVDDEEINLFIFEAMLGSTFEIYKAGSAADALSILESDSAINLIITDYKMPGKDGITFVKEATALYPDKVFMMLSAFLNNSEIESAVELGLLKECFSKPLDKAYFLKKMHEHGFMN